MTLVQDTAHQCVERVSVPGMFMMARCSRKAAVERNGKWYCRQHDPEAKKARRAAREAASAASEAATREIRRLHAAKAARDRAFVEACEAYWHGWQLPDVYRADDLVEGLLAEVREASRAYDRAVSA